MGGTFLGMRASTQIVGCMERYYGSERNLNRTYKEAAVVFVPREFHLPGGSSSGKGRERRETAESRDIERKEKTSGSNVLRKPCLRAYVRFCLAGCKSTTFRK